MATCGRSTSFLFDDGYAASRRHRAALITPANPQLHILTPFGADSPLIWGCMELSRPALVVAFELSEKRKAIVADALAGASAVVYLTELDEAARVEALRNAGALLTFHTSKVLQSARQSCWMARG